MAKLKIFSGNSNPALVKQICNCLMKTPGKIAHATFPTGEKFCRYEDNIRGADVFLVQSIDTPANDNLMELFIMADAARRASAKRITAVIPYYGYARQDRKDKPRTPISAKLIVDLLEAAGVNRIISMDLHCPQIQGMTNLPFDHLYAAPTMLEGMMHKGMSETSVFVAPDVGALKRVEAIAQVAGEKDIAIVTKKRKNAQEVEKGHLIGDVNGRDVVIWDDLSESLGTLINAAKECKEGGATKIWCAITHGLFNEKGFVNLSEDININHIYTTDTVPFRGGSSSFISYFSVAKVFAEAIKNTHNNQSISKLFSIKGF